MSAHEVIDESAVGHAPAVRSISNEAALRRAGLWGDATVLDWFALATASVGERCAVVDRSGSCLTFGELDALSTRLAGWMRSRGVRPHDVVSVQLPNWSEFTLIYVACLKVGAIINPIPANLRLQELTYMVNKCASVMTFHPTRFRTTDYEGIAHELRAQAPTVRECVLVDRLGVPCVEFPSLSEVLVDGAPAAAPIDARPRTISGTDVAAILFTSGSEAQPKGVMLSHNNLIASERAFAATLNVNWNDAMFMPAPLGHATGFLHGVTMPLISQITSILCDATDGASMVDMLRAHHATGAMAVPAVAETVLDECVATARDLPDLRFLCCGGSPVPRSLVCRAREFGVALYSVYGSTESAPHTMTTFSDSEERVIHTDGRACWGTEIRVVDPETRRTLPAGECGEEASRGPAVFMGYLGEPGLTSAVVDDDGWYYSGDLCVMDDDGYIRITGRLKDVIIRGGENISVAEVELIVRAHPRVREAAVIGVDDRTLGQRLCACIVSRDGAPITVEELKEYFRSQSFAKFKTPEQVVMLTEMPLTSSGKISKGKLREAYSHPARHADETCGCGSDAAGGDRQRSSGREDGVK